MRKLILLALVTLTTAALLSCSSSDSASQNNPAPKNSPYAKQAEPSTSEAAYPRSSGGAYAGLYAVDVDGNRHDLSEWVGKKPVVVNFWGTWCPPCRREIPGLVRLYGEYRDRGVEIVSLAIERSAGPLQVKQFSEQAGMSWVMLMSNEDVVRAFRLSGSVPTTIFFDAGGNEVARHIGARSYDDFKREFEKVVGS